MKKTRKLILGLVLIFLLSSCNGGENSSEIPKSSSEATEISAAESSKPLDEEKTESENESESLLISAEESKEESGEGISEVVNFTVKDCAMETARVGMYGGYDEPVIDAETGKYIYGIRFSPLGRDSLNYEKLFQNAPSEETIRVTIFKLENKKELDAFTEKYKDSFYFEQKYNDLNTYYEVTSKMDDEFFKKNTVIFSYVEATSGGSVYEIKSVDISKDEIFVHIEQTKFGFTNDMSGHFLFLYAPKKMVEGVSSFDADLKPMR